MYLCNFYLYAKHIVPKHMYSQRKKAIEPVRINNKSNPKKIRSEQKIMKTTNVLILKVIFKKSN